MYISISDFYDLYDSVGMVLREPKLSEIGIIWTITDSLCTVQYVGRTTETKKRKKKTHHKFKTLHIYTATAVNNTVFEKYHAVWGNFVQLNYKKESNIAVQTSSEFSGVGG